MRFWVLALVIATLFVSVFVNFSIYSLNKRLSDKLAQSIGQSNQCLKIVDQYHEISETLLDDLMGLVNEQATPQH